MYHHHQFILIHTDTQHCVVSISSPSCLLSHLWCAVIYQRQQAKGNLATITVDGESCTRQNSGFTKDELRDCFTLKDSTNCDTKDKVGDRWLPYGESDGNCFIESVPHDGHEYPTISFASSQLVRHSPLLVGAIFSSFIDGPDSLLGRNCDDEALIQTAKSQAGVLGHVHLVDEDDIAKQDVGNGSDEDSNESHDVLDDKDEVDSGEENEFEGDEDEIEDDPTEASFSLEESDGVPSGNDDDDEEEEYEFDG